MRRKVSTTVAGLALLVAWPAWADWDPGDGHKMHFPQLPDPDGWDVCLIDQWIADDFTCGETGLITDIHFWTSWKEDDEYLVDGWDITIWDDAGGQPGVQLWPVAGSLAGTFTTRFYGTGPQGWVCPSPPPLIVPNDHLNYYQVNVTDIVEPFWQEEGTTYWLVIRAIIGWDPPPAVGWKTSVNDPPGPLYQAPAKWSTDQINWGDVNTGLATDPVLHDMAFVITGGPPDCGDAPDAPYPTWLIFGGPYHIIVPGVLMGASIDGEPDGQPHPNALGDDLDGNDDEDGVFLSALWPGGTATATIDLTSSVGGFLNAWFDWNGDGDWADAGEQVFINQGLTGGVVNTLTLSVPASTVSGMVTFARFRFNTAGGLSYTGGAADGEVEDYEVTIQDQPPDWAFEFSLDIGSDIELSDPNTNGNEAADPGDVYRWQSAPIIPPGRDGFKDDLSIFGMDPNPNPPDFAFPPATRVPVGTGGTIQDYPEFFDLDGHDQLDAELYGMEWPIPQFDSPCVHDPVFLMISYDDDMAPGWPAADVPVTAPSPAGFVYGTTAGQDEIVGVNLAVAAAPPFPVQAVYPIADEVTVHPSMVPNPDFTEQDDDDVDSLDIVPSEADVCPYWYFSPDHEAHWGLDPGGIYLATVMVPPAQVIDEAFHLGLPEDTDIDAFEFTWIEDPDGAGGFYLGLLFSVDEDDPLTPLPVDESGGLDPTALYASIMTGSSWQFSDPLGDDVDALTIWRESLMPPCNPLDVRSLKLHAGAVGELALNMGVKDGIEPRAGGADKLEIDLDDASGFLGGVVVNCSPTAWTGTITTSTVGNMVTLWFSPPLSGQSYCQITLDCGAQVCVRNCEADMNRNGFTNTTDASQIKLRFGQTVTAANCEWDWDLSGAINTTDYSGAKLRFGYSAPQCP